MTNQAAKTAENAFFSDILAAIDYDRPPQKESEPKTSFVECSQNVHLPQVDESAPVQKTECSQNVHIPNSAEAEKQCSQNVHIETSAEIIKKLNEMAARGVGFQVSPEKFYLVGDLESVTQEGVDYLTDHYGAILCHLQQNLLQRRMFADLPEHFEDYSFEIKEREAVLLSEGNDADFSYTHAVMEITKKWFGYLIEEGL